MLTARTVPGGRLDATLQRRAEIQAATAGLTLCDLLDRRARDRAESPALAWRSRASPQRWQTLTWAGYRRRARDLAAGLVDLGVEAGERVAVMAPNRVEHFLTEHAILLAGGVPVPLFPTLPPDDIAHCARTSGTAVAVLQGDAELDRWLRIVEQLDALRHVVVMDDTDGKGLTTVADLEDVGRHALRTQPDLLEARRRDIAPGQPCAVLFSSGTTAAPRAIRLTHAGILYAGEAWRRLVDIPATPTCVSFLPLAHIGERMVSLYQAVVHGGCVYVSPDPAGAFDDVADVRPSVFFGPPRVWERMREKVLAGLERGPEGPRKRLVRRGLDVGRRSTALRRAGRRQAASAAAEHAVLDRAVLAAVRRMVGLDRCRLAFCGGAPVPEHVAEFFWTLGVPFVDCYGLTETSGAVTVGSAREPTLRLGGRPLPGIEIALGDDGEVRVRGPIVASLHPSTVRTSPAHGTAAPNASGGGLTDADGWFATGDVGRIDEEGCLQIVGRKKEVIITSGGANVPPAKVEAMLDTHPLVRRSLVVGDGRPHLAALVSLDVDVAREWALQRGIDATDAEALARHSDVVVQIEHAMAMTNSYLGSPEQIRAVAIVADEWSVESGDLTPSGKLRRARVQERHRDAIARLYADAR